MATKKVLITGGAGYIGSIATFEFLKHGFEVVVFDNLSTGYLRPLDLLKEKFGPNKLRFYQVDLNDNLSPLLKKEDNIFAVVHFAGSLIVDESMKDPGKYFYNNISSSINLLREMSKSNIKNMVFSSTCAVYGQAKYIPIDENHPQNPDNPYGLSKKMVEEIINCYGERLGLKFIIFRYFNVCGASFDGQLGYSSKSSTHLISNAVKGALGIAPFYLTCAQVPTADETPIRDYINVVDLAQAHVKGVEYLLDGGSSQTINLGTGTGSSVLEIIKEVERVTNVKLNVTPSTPRVGEAAEMIAAVEKASNILGWQAQTTLEDSVKSTVSWFQKHPKGWEQ